MISVDSRRKEWTYIFYSVNTCTGSPEKHKVDNRGKSFQSGQWFTWDRKAMLKAKQKTSFQIRMEDLQIIKKDLQNIKH